MTIKIDLDKCVRCGRCARVCTTGTLAFKDGAPVVLNESRCMHCHHCYAACPVGAVAMDGLDTSACKPEGAASPESVLALLRNRYSCREYRPERVSSAKMEMLRGAVESSPTGCNARATGYVILDDVLRTDALRKAIVEKVESADPEVVKAHPMLRAIKLMSKRGVDMVLRGAPHVVVAAYAPSAPTGFIDCIVGLSHFEITAQSLGLGTCWCGFLREIEENVWPGMLDYFGFPPGFRFGYAMLFGEKEFDYARPVAPNPLGQPHS